MDCNSSSHLPACFLSNAGVLTSQTSAPINTDVDDDLCITSQQLQLESNQNYEVPFLKFRSHCRLPHWKWIMAMCGCCIPRQSMRNTFKTLLAADDNCFPHYHSHHNVLPLPLLPTNNRCLLMEVKCDC